MGDGGSFDAKDERSYPGIRVIENISRDTGR